MLIPDENRYFVHAHRELDNRTVYIKAELTINQWSPLHDALIDSKFILRKIDELDFKKATDNFAMVYDINSLNYISFTNFIAVNYVETKKIMTKKNMPHF